MDNCIFCKIIAGTLPATVLYQDHDVMVIKDIHPQAPVHWLVVAKKHIAELVDADDALLAEMVSIIKKIIKNEHITGYRIVNNGKGAAVIDHIHMHILGNIDKFRKL